MDNLHEDHDHQHGPSCGHTGVKHEGHVDYLHDGHLHHHGQGGVEEHAVAVSATNPAGCTPHHDCGQHDKNHRHGPGCGHEAVPHGDHCDDHGKIDVVKS